MQCNMDMMLTVFGSIAIAKPVVGGDLHLGDLFSAIAHLALSKLACWQDVDCRLA